MFWEAGRFEYVGKPPCSLTHAIPNECKTRLRVDTQVIPPSSVAGVVSWVPMLPPLILYPLGSPLKIFH